VQWLIETIAGWLGISPLAAVGLLVVASMVVSSLLRWHRGVREQEYYYLELAASGRELSAADFANPQAYGERVLAETVPDFRRRARRRDRVRPSPGQTGGPAPPDATRPPRRGRPLPGS
jgi:alkylation response protein AidB-like acyl-CoA dehydrogenase